MQYTDQRPQQLPGEEANQCNLKQSTSPEKQKEQTQGVVRKTVTVLIIIIIVSALAAIMFLIYKNAQKPVSSPTVISEEDKYDFSAIYYYEPDKLDRYISYRELHPELSIEDVVWRVNSHLDKPWYKYDVPVDGYDDPYIIVNKYYTVPEGYEPPDLVSVDGILMRSATGEAYKQMKKDAAADGMSITAVSGYRSVEYQQNLYNSYLANDSLENADRYSARAGHSEHHTGMALDLFGSIDGLRNFEHTPEYEWLKSNGYKYGFIIRYTAATENITGYEDEPWHIRYVGKKVSTDMHNKGITSFEEYHVKYIAHSPNE